MYIRSLHLLINVYMDLALIHKWVLLRILYVLTTCYIKKQKKKKKRKSKKKTYHNVMEIIGWQLLLCILVCKSHNTVGISLTIPTSTADRRSRLYSWRQWFFYIKILSDCSDTDTSCQNMIWNRFEFNVTWWYRP